MKRGVLAAWGLLAGCWCSVAAAQPHAMDRIPLQRLSLGDIGGWIEVTVYTDGVPDRWLIDTGSNRNLVSAAFAGRHALASLRTQRADTATGAVQGAEVKLPRLTLGGVERSDQTALRLDDLRSLVGPAGEGLAGILGAAFLTGMALDLDLREWTLHLAASTPAACPPGMAAVPLGLHRGLPVIDVSINGQAVESLLLDTGNPAGVVHVVDTLPDASTPGLALAGGTRLTVARQVSIGELQRTHVPVVRLPAPALRHALGTRITGLAGTALLDGSRWLIDIAQQRACVETQHVAVPGGFGLTLVQRDGGVWIEAVLPGGPAEAAGLRAGEPIHHWVDGPPVGPMRDVWARAQRKDTIELRVGHEARSVQLRRAWFAPALP